METMRRLSRQEEAQLSTIAHSGLGGLFQAQMDEDFTLLYANDTYYDLHGYTREQMERELGNRAIGLIHPEEAGRINKLLAQAQARGEKKVSFEYRVRRRDGQVVWVQLSARMFMDRQPATLSGMILDITGKKTVEAQLDRSEERLQIAIRQAGIGLWEYNIPGKRIYPVAASSQREKDAQTFDNVPESMVEAGYVHPNSVQDYLAMYDALQRGEPSAEAVVQVKSPEGPFHWERIHYTTILDEGKPIRAVAVTEDVSAQKYAEHRYTQEEQLREMLSVDVLISAKMDLTANTVGDLWSGKEKPPPLRQVGTCDELLDLLGDYLASPEERKKCRERYRRARLLEDYREGRHTISTEFRCVNFSGEILWTNINATLMEDPETGNIVLFGYIRDIDKRKKAELALLERAEKDGVTGLYNKSTIESMVRAAIREGRRKEGQCALLVLDMDNFKQINDRYGHLHGDKLLGEMGRLVQAAFQSKSLAGRIGGDEFLLFLEEVPNERWVFEQTDTLCKSLALSYETERDRVAVSASIGVAFAPRRQAEFEKLFSQADSGLYHAKKQGKGRYSCHQDQRYFDGDGEVTAQQCPAKAHVGKACMVDELEELIVVIDAENHDMLYMNAPAKQAFQVEASEYLGTKCYKLLQGFSQPCVFCQNHLPTSQGFQFWENQNAKLHKPFAIRDKIIQWGGRPARLEVFHPQPVREEGQSMEQFLLETVGFLLSADSADRAIQGILERLGQFYCADRCYFVRAKEGDQAFAASHQWLRAGIPAPNLGRANEGARWLAHLSRQHVVACRDIETLRLVFPEKYTEMKAKEVQSFYAVALLEEGALRGYLGLENPRERLDTTTLLISTSYFLLGELNKREQKARCEFLQDHDGLTGCLNWQKYNETLMDFRWDAATSLGVLRGDINHLEDINRCWGCEEGNRLVAETGRILREQMGAEHVYRTGGDSFSVLWPDVSYDKFSRQATACRAELARESPGKVALGWTWGDQNTTVADMIRHAGEALRLDKQVWGCKKKSPADTMRRNVEEAIAQGRFQIYLQPKAEVATGRIQGAEALVRYQDDTHGLVFPDKFIPLLERAGLIRCIDLFVLEAVCKTLHRWKTNGMEPIPISLNFSRATLLEEGILEEINALANRYQVDRSLLEIEITETISDVERQVLGEISRDIIGDGYRLSLDDFGAQYSNLSILSSLELSELKIDKSIINDLYSNPNTRLVVENLIQICRQLGIDSVAEGVEETEQLQVLESLGCTYAQGYLYNKPIPVRDFERKYLLSGVREKRYPYPRPARVSGE